MAALQVAWSQITQAPLFRLGTTPITIGWMIQVALLLMLVSLFTKGLRQLLKNIILKRLGMSEGTRGAVAILFSWSMGALGYVLVLQAMGLQLESFALVVSGLGVGIGLGLKELTKNWASGLTLLGERKLKVGDLIEFNNKLGYIQDISIRSTVIRTFRGSELIVPNSELTNRMVENWSYQDCQSRIEIPLKVVPTSDLSVVTEILLAAAFTHSHILRSPPPKVMFQGFQEGSISLELWAWVDRVDQRAGIRSALHFAIAHGLRQHQIQLAPTLPHWVAAESEPSAAEAGAIAPATVPTQPLKDLLRSISYFQGFTPLEIEFLIQLGYRRQLATAEILYQQGDGAHEFCIVLKGAIEAIFENQRISRRLFSFAEGEFFGELPLMLNVPYPTTMRAAEPTELFLIHRDGFQLLLNNHPHLLEVISQAMGDRQDVLESYRHHLEVAGLLEDSEPKSLMARFQNQLRQWVRHWSP